MRNSGGHKARAVANTMRQFIDAAHTPAANPRVWAPYVVLGFPAGLRERPAPLRARGCARHTPLQARRVLTGSVR